MNKKGFTLIELIIVLAISVLLIGVVAQLLIPGFNGIRIASANNTQKDIANQAMLLIKDKVHQPTTEIIIPNNCQGTLDPAYLEIRSNNSGHLEFDRQNVDQQIGVYGNYQIKQFYSLNSNQKAIVLKIIITEGNSNTGYTVETEISSINSETIYTNQRNNNSTGACLLIKKPS